MVENGNKLTSVDGMDGRKRGVFLFGEIRMYCMLESQ